MTQEADKQRNRKLELDRSCSERNQTVQYITFRFMYFRIYIYQLSASPKSA